MAKRPRAASTTGRTRQRRGGARAGQSSADGLFDPSALFDRAHPLGRVTALLLLQALEWQAALLDVYRRVLDEGAFDAPVEDQMRKVARNLMAAYLEVLKTMPERRARLMEQHAEMVKAMAKTVEDLREQLSTQGS
jgi:hypothetical protein